MKIVRFFIFLAAAAILGLGFFGLTELEKEAGMGFLLGCLTLGGGFLITALFSLKMPWHGIIGAGTLALLGLCRGALNFPDFAKYLVGERERGVAPALELCVSLVCAMLLIRVLRVWAAERKRNLDIGA
ncbi:MAG: hypothetical protein RLZZ505_260 [Verrucomicrobiota bacterium]|jgi:hypothetical protein